MEGLCGSEIFQRGLWVQTFYPPGGTPRLYGRQDACRYGHAVPPRHRREGVLTATTFDVKQETGIEPE
jgi:hypothetical protein